ncbi:hypothetical protein [Aquibacillus saliphilus]|uniref:hypothetical protein n=1 Tax=Aquibacillus saliphilus TaxID=1909422 RepID=UPI001CEFC520|nr:hypothetical protein [Aquibacillus saliphilus]
MHYGRLTVLAIVLVLFLPPFLVNSYQKTIATGVYALSYQQEDSNCTFELENETTLLGVCELSFKNYSLEDVSFTIEFYEDYVFEDDIRMVSLMNNNAPYQVNMRARGDKRVKIETEIDVSEMENYPHGGSASGVNIIIRSEDKYRKL